MKHELTSLRRLSTKTVKWWWILQLKLELYVSGFLSPTGLVRIPQAWERDCRRKVLSKWRISVSSGQLWLLPGEWYLSISCQGTKDQTTRVFCLCFTTFIDENHDPLSCATVESNSGYVRLRNSAEILGLGPHLFNRIWVGAIILLLKCHYRFAS